MSKQLIRFDWAVKKLLRNKANFVVLEGFLSELLFDDVRIEKILESESNQESQEDKFNRVDILTQNSKGELIIVEIQNSYEIDYFHRMVYGSSKVVSENMSLGQSYATVKKVISINIVYFDLGQGEDYIYKGKTTFKGLHEKDILTLSQRQKNVFVKQNVSDIFPEYYIIKVNKFDDIAKDSLDEWIYFLKNSELKDDFKAKGLKEAGDVLDIMRLPKEEQHNYNRYKKHLHDKASEMFTIKTEEQFRMEEVEKRAKETVEKAEEAAKEAIQKARESVQEAVKKAREAVERAEIVAKETTQKAKETAQKAKETAQKAKEDGISAGTLKSQMDIAQNAIQKGADNQFIADITGLTIEQIIALRISLTNN